MIGPRTRLYLNTFFAIAFFIIVLFSRLAYYSLETHLILLGVYIIIGAIWLIYAFKFPAAFSQSPLNLGWLAILIALTLSSFFSLNPAQSWRLAWSWAIAPASFCLVYFFLKLKLFTVRFILQTCVAVFSIFLIAGYLEVWQVGSLWLATDRLTSFTVGLIHGWTESRNILALFLVWIIAISTGFIVEKNQRRSLWLAVLILPLPLLFLASSAGGYISLLAIIIALVIGYNAKQIGHFWLSLKRPQKILAGSSLAVATLLGGFVAINWLSTDPGFADRLYYWEIARGTFYQNPLFGMGLGTHITSFIKGSDFLLKRRLFFNPHSFLFTVLADLGLIGIVAIAIWFIQTASLLVKRFRVIIESSQALTLVACLSAFSVHALIETPRPRLFLIATIFLACLIAETDQDERPAKPNRSIKLAYVWPLIFVGLGIGLWHSYRVQQQYELGVAQAEEGNWADASSHFAHADELSFYPETAVVTAAAYTQTNLELQNGADKMDTSHWEQLIAQEPSWPINHLHLALVQEKNGDLATAEASYQYAAQTAGDMPYPYLNLAKFYERTDQTEKAEATYKQLYALSNSWHQAPLWESINIENSEIRCEDRTCFYYSWKELEQAWSLMTAGNREEARLIFEKIQPLENYNNDPAVYLGLYLTESDMVDQFSSDQALRFASVPAPAFFTFVPELFLLDELDEEFISLRLDRITAHAAQGFSLKSNGDYIRLGYLRSALPYDLLPTVQCFTVNDHMAWQLTQLEAWYTTNGLDAYAQMVNEAKLGPNGNGVGPCIHPDS